MVQDERLDAFLQQSAVRLAERFRPASPDLKRLATRVGTDVLGKRGSTAPAPAIETRTDLTPLDRPLTAEEATHLLRRTSFGASNSTREAYTGMSAATAAQTIIQEAQQRPLPEAPPWVDDGFPIRGSEAERQAYVEANLDRLFDYQAALWTELYTGGFRERMMLVWHNLLVTSAEVYFLAPFAYRYLTLLRTQALGSYQDLVYAMGLDPAMLVYLNGLQNRVGEPNENYARELLELFTMGRRDTDGSLNYTDSTDVEEGAPYDINELARALTGWIVGYDSLDVAFIPGRHDTGPKTIFGVTDTFTYDSALALIFEERAPQIARYICRHLYTSFVYQTADENVVDQMATVFLDNDFAIAPVMQALLSSEHFYDAALRGAQVVSPAGLITRFYRAMDTPPPPAAERFLSAASGLLGQNLLYPPNVAGWPGGRTWVTTATLSVRWLLVELLAFGNGRDLPGVDIIALAASIHDQNDPLAAFKLPVALAEHLFAVPLESLQIDAPSEPFGGNLVRFPIPEEVENGPLHEKHLAQIFLQGVPWYEWRLDIENGNLLIALYLRYLSQLPSFQLT